MSGASSSERSSTWINLVGLGLLLICYAGAIWNVISNKRQEDRATVIRLVHWQLELGVRDGLEELITRFEAYKSEQGEQVDVVQIPVPEQAYNQYVTTQLIGGTAPDLIQIGKFANEYLGRFFFPLSEAVQQPNPFWDVRRSELEGMEERSPAQQKELEVVRELAGRPWMDTFTDGLRGQFQEDFQEYYGVGFSNFTVRMYFNKSLFGEILGDETPPQSYQELIDACLAIEAYAERTGRDIQPIASSMYQAEVFRHRYFSEITPDVNRELDIDLNGWADGFEKLAGLLRGDFSPWNPQYRAAMELILELAQFFPKGFMSLDRQDSGFSFVQGRAAMITSGSWDALSYLKKIQDQPEGRRFEVGIFDLPSISDGHEEFGEYADGRATEAATGTAFAFGITRYTRNPELCIEFLQFATTPEMNTVVNQIAGWIPAVRGATPRDLLKNFQPNYVGYFGTATMEINGGGKALLEERQLFWPLVQGDISYEEYAEDLWENLPAAAATDFKRMYEGSRESIPNRELRRSSFLAASVLSRDPEDRLRNEIKLLRSLQPLMGLITTQAKADVIMAQAREQISGEPHVQEFAETFDRSLKRELTQ